MNHTTQRTVDVLQLIATSEGEMSLSVIARELDMPKSSAFSIVHTLEENGFLQKHALSGGYSLGPALCSLGFTYLRRNNLVRIARLELISLHEETGRTIFLASRDRHHMIYLDKVEPQAQVHFSANIGTTSGILASGLGKATLAAMKDDEIRDLATDDFFQSSSDPQIRDMDSLLEYLCRARKRGFVVDSGQDASLLIHSVAVPVLDSEGKPIAAISAVSLKTDNAENEDRIAGEKAVRTALRISCLFGYNGDRVLYG